MTDSSQDEVKRKLCFNGKLMRDLGIYKLPNAAFKLWTYYRGREHKDKKVAWPTDPTAAEDCGMSPASVNRAKRWLRKHGWISTESKHKSGAWYVETTIPRPIKMIGGANQNDCSTPIKMTDKERMPGKSTKKTLQEPALSMDLSTDEGKKVVPITEGK